MLAFETVAALVADTSITIGDYCSTAGYFAPGDGGGNVYEIVASGGTADAGSLIDLVGISGQAKANGAAPTLLQWGVSMDKVSADTGEIQKALDYTAAHAGFLGGGRVNHDTRQSVVSQVTFYGAGAVYDLDQIVLRCEASVATTSAVEWKLGQGRLTGLTVASAFDTSYSTGVHRYTNNLNAYYAGREKFSDVTISGFKYGLTIGGLPSQGLVTYGQGTVQSPGIATDAPISEEFYHGIDIQDCVVGLYMNQPNGKVTFSNSNINAEPLGWVAQNGSAPVTPTALVVAQGELTVLGGAIEAIQSSGGLLMDLYNLAHVNVIGSTLEANASPVWMEGGARLRISNIQNWGLNGDSPFILVHSGWYGDLVCSDMFMLRTAGYAGSQSVVKAASGRSGSFLPNLSGRLSFSNVEFGEANFAGGSVYNPLCIGVDAEFRDCVLTTGHMSGGAYIRDTAYRLDTSDNVLQGVIDISNAALPAFGANGNGGGGWTVSVGGGGSNQWGKETAGMPVGHWGSGGAALRLATSASGAYVEACTAAAPVSAHKAYIFKGLMLSNGSSGNITIRAMAVSWSGANLTSVDLYRGPASGMPTSWSPFMFYFIASPAAASVRIYITVQDGSGVQVKNLFLG